MKKSVLKQPATWTIFFLTLTVVSLVFFIIFKSTIETYLDAIFMRTAWFLFLVFLLCGIATLLIELIRRHNRRIYEKIVKAVAAVTIFLTVFLIMLVIFELVLRAIQPEPQDFLDLRGIQRISPYPGVLYEPKPETAKTFTRKNVGTITYRINKLGMRGKEVTVKKPENIYRILTVGDSVSFGIDLAVKNRYTEILQEMLNEYFSGHDVKFQVLNMSTGGWNTFNERCWLQAKGLDLQPDMILWQFHVNDIDDPITHLGTNSLCMFTELPDDYFPNPDDPAIESNIFTQKPSEIPLSDVINWYGFRFSVLYQRFFTILNPPKVEKDIHYGKQLFEWCLEWLSNTDSIQWRWLRRELGRLQDILQKNDIPMFFLITPMAYQLNSDTPIHNLSLQNLENYLAENDIPTINFTPRLEKKTGEDRYKYYLDGDPSHFNIMGHRLLAEEIFRKIRPYLEEKLEIR